MATARNWDELAVGKSGDLQISVGCSRETPSRWAASIRTGLLYIWVEMPDHTVPRQVLQFFEQTHGKRRPVRPDMDLGTFCGRPIRLRANDDDESYFLDLWNPSDGGASAGHLVLWLEADQVESAMRAVRQVVEMLDRRKRRQDELP